MRPEDLQAKIDGLNAEGLDRIVRMLKKGKAPQPMIDQIEKMSAVEETMPVITDWVEEIMKGMPHLPGSPQPN